MGGPVLPGEFRPLAPVPASSESGDPPICTEQQAIRALIVHYRWCWTGVGQLKKYNPHGRNINAEVEALGNG
jgi:hypothetical protein